MLVELRLANLAVVESARLELVDGLNVLSGSTGAGKSLVIEALRWLCGERIDHGVLRPGAELAFAEAIFDLHERTELLAAIAALGIDVPTDGLLRIRRELRSGGRSRALLGAELTTTSLLAALMSKLVSLQSQHEQLSLLDPAQHVRLLDACGVATESIQHYEEALERHKELQARIAVWRTRRERLLAERDFLEFQVRELESAQLRAGELESLRERVRRASGGVRLRQALDAAQAALGDEERGALSALGRAQSALAHGPNLAQSAQWLEALQSASALSEDVHRSLLRELDADSEDPAELDRLQQRLYELETLTRKYGRDEAQLLAWSQRLRADLDLLGEGEDLPRELASESERALADLAQRAEALLRARRAAALRASESAQPLLERLGMHGASLEFELAPRLEPGSRLQVAGEALRAQADGTHAVRLLVRTNKGARKGPVERVASGGELSRIGLVLRCLSTLASRPLLLILDEVDSGLGADLGPALASTLSELARGEQLLVITHLPAVAAAARRHFVVHKDPGSEQAVSELRALDAQARVEELARMLGGNGSHELQLARRLLRGAERAA